MTDHPSLTVPIAAAIFQEAMDLELGVALIPDYPEQMKVFDAVLRKAQDQHPQFKIFMICMMDNPKEVWLIKRDTELDEAKQFKRRV